MKATICVIALVVTSLSAVVPALADCELSCSAECKQEQSLCISEAILDGKLGRQACETEAGDAALECETDAVDSRADCVGLCGVDLKDCGGDVKATLKQCKEQVKIDLDGCENEVATLLAADRAACADGAADCAASCAE